MNTTTRTIAALAATGAIVVGGAAAASATTGDDVESKRAEVSQLVHDAVEDGTVTVEEETAIQQAIEDNSDIEFESLDDAAPVR